MNNLTPAQERRILQAMAETIHGLERAQRYSPEFQDKKLIADYEAHIAKLQRLLSGEQALAPVWTPETARQRVGGTFGT